MTAPGAAAMLRDDDSIGRVTHIELFYDLVYVFAITQLSAYLYDHQTFDGALQTAVLLAMVWQVWVYTTWMTNYLDPNGQSVRLVLVLLMLGSLVLAAAVPDAFDSLGALVAIVYVVMQVGRSIFIAVGLRGHPLSLTFARATFWSVLAGVAILGGAAVHGHVREVLWIAGVLIEVGGSLVGFVTPGLGRSSTADWTIDGRHFAERCQAFVLIALGESIIVSGSTLTPRLHHAHAQPIIAFVVVFFSSVALWWVYFDRAAEDSSRKIDESDDPGRLGRNAFHLVHPLIVAGVIVSAAAVHIVLTHPDQRGHSATTWLVLGGTALFLAGHAVFKAMIWRHVSWQRVIAVAALALLGVLAPHVTALTLSVAALVVVLCVIVADRIQLRGLDPVRSARTPA
jgi:low temperature requirement protein LtrA